LIGLGFGTFFLIRRDALLNDGCPCGPGLANDASNAATISFGLGGAALASALVFQLTSPSTNRSVGWAVSPTPLSGGAGAVFTKSF
jgi:hypothetical protein